MYQVYVKADEQNRITAINSSEFLSDMTGWIQIAEGDGDRFHHAQGNYFDKSLFEEHFIPRYKLVDGVAAERTQAEIDADIAAIPAPPISADVLQNAQIQALADRNEFLEDCIAEMAGMVYAG